MVAIRSKFGQIVLSQPRKILKGLQPKIGFKLPPEASSLISLVH
jgi:hypothetical protein